MTLTLYNPSVPAAADSNEVQRHQCFVGEILHIGLSVNSTKLAVKDQDGNNLRIGFTFPDDTHDKERIPLNLLKRGLTILILTASIEDLPGGGNGIKVPDPRLVKILPFRMSFLLNLAEIYSEFAAQYGSKRVCCCCGVCKYGLQRCPRCRVFFFCSRECQETAIYHEDHKVHCAVLRDPDMIFFFSKQWKCLQEFRCVSLQS